MQWKLTKTLLLALPLFVLLLATATFVGAEDPKEFKESFDANAIALGHGLSSNLQITITRWTTDEERDLLLTTLVKDGQEAMIKILGKQKETGFVRLPNKLGYRLYYAREFKKDGKRKIILATDRPISMAEAWRDNRSMDYAIAMIELLLDAEDKGEGALLFGVKLTPNQETKTLAIENYGTDPVQLKNVRKNK